MTLHIVPQNGGKSTLNNVQNIAPFFPLFPGVDTKKMKEEGIGFLVQPETDADDPRLAGRKSKIFREIKLRSTKHGYCNRDVPEFAAKFRMAESSVTEYLRQLICDGLIQSYKQRNKKQVLIVADQTGLRALANLISKDNAQAQAIEATRKASAERKQLIQAGQMAQPLPHSQQDTALFQSSIQNLLVDFPKSLDEAPMSLDQTPKIFGPSEREMPCKTTFKKLAEENFETTTFISDMPAAEEESREDVVDFSPTFDGIPPEKPQHDNDDNWDDSDPFADEAESCKSQQEPARDANDAAVDKACQEIEDKLLLDRKSLHGRIEEMKDAGDCEADIALVLSNSLTDTLKVSDANVKTTRQAIFFGVVRNTSRQLRAERQASERAKEVKEREYKEALEAACLGENPQAVIARFVDFEKRALAGTGDKPAFDRIRDHAREVARNSRGNGKLDLDGRNARINLYHLTSFLLFERGELPVPDPEELVPEKPLPVIAQPVQPKKRLIAPEPADIKTLKKNFNCLSVEDKAIWLNQARTEFIANGLAEPAKSAVESRAQNLYVASKKAVSGDEAGENMKISEGR